MSASRIGACSCAGHVRRRRHAPRPRLAPRRFVQAGVLRSAFDRGYRDTAKDLLGLFQQLAAADDGGEALATLIGYLGYVSRPGDDLVAELKSHLSGLALEKVMELEDMLARKKREEGRAEGRAERGAELVLKQLRLKFGELDADTVTRVRGATEADLDLWAERVLTAGNLADVFA